MPDRFTRKNTLGTFKGGYAIACSTCEQVEAVYPTNETGTLPPEAITKKFRQRGWTVGRKPSRDQCPACKEKPVNVIPMPAQEPPMPAAPATISREDRRIILSKLNDVYMSEELGYSPGWTDQRVSEDLGVPVEWVQDLRSQNFGDLPSSSQDDAMREEGMAIRDAHLELESRLMAQFVELESKLVELGKLRAAFERKYGLLVVAA